MDADLFLRLAAPFPPDDVGWKPQAVKGNRALAIAYIDARNVMDRLDEVVGPGGWKDAYDVLSEGSVVCHLSLKVGGEWITKSDVGSPSEQPDGGDRMKAAFSDALKRAGVRWGIGRYLYSLPHQWADYDPAKKQFVAPPRLPAWAVPKAAAKSNGKPPAPTPATSPADDIPDEPITVDVLDVLLRKAGKTWEQARSQLAEKVDRELGDADLDDLTQPERRVLMSGLQRLIDQRKAAATVR
jgi:hypothetical protein